MAEDDASVTNNDIPVSQRLGDFDLPDFATASETWRCRADELWSLAQQSGDLRAMAQSLQAGLKSLSDWATQLQQQQQATQTAMSQQQKDAVIAADANEVVARFDAFMAKRGLTQKCQLCDGMGATTPAINNLVLALFGHSGPYLKEWRRAVGFTDEEETDVNSDNAIAN